MLNLNTYISELEKKIKAIENADSEIKITNAGFMNGGKSSLFNALLNKNVFAVADRRCTRKPQQEKLRDNVFLVDTPGLAADAEDDEQAYEVYKKADLIIFIHGLKAAAELRKEEIDKIQRIIKVFPSEESFWDRFYLVLTYADEYESKDEREKIKESMAVTFKKYLSESEFPIFFVSNIDYEFWLNDKNEDDLLRSGIVDLQKALQDGISKCQLGKKDLSHQRISTLINNAKKELIAEREKCERLLENKQNEIKQKKVNAGNIINSFFASIKDIKEKLRQKQRELNSL